MDWPKKIKEIKKHFNIRTTELARRLDLTSHYLADIERGKSKNPAATLPEILLKKLKINPVWLFTDEGKMFIEQGNSRIEELEEENSKLKQEVMNQNFSLEHALPILKKLSSLKNIKRNEILNFLEVQSKDQIL